MSWAPDGSAFYITTNERDPKFFDLYRVDARDQADSDDIVEAVK